MDNFKFKKCRMAQDTMDNFKMEKGMAMEFSFEKTELIIKVNIKMERKMA